MVITDILSILQIIGVFVGIIGGVAGLISLYFTLSEKLNPKLEINVYLPQSAKYVIPLNEGIVPKSFNQEKIMDDFDSKLDISHGVTKSIRSLIKTIGETIVNDPKKSAITVFIKNIGKRTVNLCSFGINLYSDSTGIIRLKEWEITEILPADRLYSREITIGDLLTLIKPYNLGIEDNVKLIFYFKDENEKHKPYERPYPFNLAEWEDLIETYDTATRELKEIDVGIEQLSASLSELASKIFVK